MLVPQGYDLLKWGSSTALVMCFMYFLLFFLCRLSAQSGTLHCFTLHFKVVEVRSLDSDECFVCYCVFFESVYRSVACPMVT